MRKTLLVTLLLVLLLPLGDVSTAQEKVTLEFWGGWTGPDGDIMRQLVEQFNAEHPDIQVNLTVQQWSPLFDAFIVAAGAGDAPDILAMHPQEMAAFIEPGLILPLDDIFAGSEVINPDKITPSAWAAHTYNGQLYGVPLDQHMHGLYYNVDAFEKAGLSAPPETGAELLETMRLLTVDESGKHPGDEGFDPEKIVQYAINMHTNHHAFFQWWSLYRQQGGELISADGKSCVMDLEKSAKAWQWLQDLVYTYHYAPQGQTDYVRDFLDGRTAMLVDGPWQIPAMEKAAADTGFRWATAKYPLVFDEFKVWGSSHTLTLPADADPDKQSYAVQFIEWLVSHQFPWALSGQIPVYKDVLESPEFLALEGRAAFVEMLPGLQTFPQIPKYNEIFASNAPTPMMVLAQSVILEQADPYEASQLACDEINFILSE